MLALNGPRLQPMSAQGPRRARVPLAEPTLVTVSPSERAGVALLPPALKAQVVELIAAMLVANLKRKRGLAGATVVSRSGCNRGPEGAAVALSDEPEATTMGISP